MYITLILYIPTCKTYHFIYKIFIYIYLYIFFFVFSNRTRELAFKIKGLNSQKPHKHQSFTSQKENEFWRVIDIWIFWHEREREKSQICIFKNCVERRLLWKIWKDTWEQEKDSENKKHLSLPAARNVFSWIILGFNHFLSAHFRYFKPVL